MKCFLMLSFAFLLCNPVFAQVITPNKMMNTNPSIREKLVTLALQNPQLEIADRHIKSAQYNVKISKRWWLSSFSLHANANEFTIKRLKGDRRPNGAYYSYYPIYNVGVSIPIGGLFTKPLETKIAKQQLAVAQAARNSEYRQIKATVLSAYEDYLTNKQLYMIQSQITESSYNNFLQAKQKFRNGQITIDDYNAAAEQYHGQLKTKIGAEHDFNITKIQLEAIIGVPLSSVIANERPDNSATDSTKVN